MTGPTYGDARACLANGGKVQKLGTCLGTWVQMNKWDLTPSTPGKGHPDDTPLPGGAEWWRLEPAPQPRYTVEHDDGADRWFVRDANRNSLDRWPARVCDRVPDAEGIARRMADELNRNPDGGDA